MLLSSRAFRLSLLGVATLAAFSCSKSPLQSLAGPRPTLPALPEDEPGEALARYLENRVPLGTREIPMERYVTARDRIQRMAMYSSRARQFVDPKARRSERAASLGQWQYMGPGNVGGRTRAFVINPQDPRILYAGGVAGGVWKSVDEGGSWRPLTDFLANLAVSTLAIDPRDPNILYAGTGEGFNNIDAVRGLGIFKSVDAGENWVRLPGATFPFTNKLVISHRDPKRLYAATNTGVWRTLDSGLTWTQVLKRDVANQFGCQDLAIRTDLADDVVFASCRATPQGAIFRTKNGAGDDPWESVFTAEFMARTSLAIAPSRQDTIYALAASSEPGTCPTNPGARPIGACYRDGLLAVFRSDENGGAGTWLAKAKNSDDNQNPGLLTNAQGFFADVCGAGNKSFSSQGWYDNVIAVDPVDPERVWAGGIDLFRSDDGASTFAMASYWASRGVRQYVHADQHGIFFHPGYDGDKNKTAYFTGDGGVFRTLDARSDVAAGRRGPCSSSNSGMTFQDLNTDYGVTQFYHGSQYPGGHFFIAGAQDNGTQRGTVAEGPNRWTRVIGGDGGYVAVDPRDARVVFGETTRLSLLRALDGQTFRGATRGITEPSGNFAFITPFVFDPTNYDRMWIGGRILWRSTDGASNWVQASKQLTTTSSINMIAVSPLDGNRVMAGTRDGFVYRTSSGLDSNDMTDWLTARPRTGVVSWIAYDSFDPDVTYVTYSNFNSLATDRHIYKTTDGGVTWFGIDGSGDTGLPDIPVHSILPDPNRRETLYAGTDAGVFVTLDGGATWNREDTGVPYTVVESLSLEKTGTGSYLIAFTHGRGVWRVWLGPGDPCTYELSPGEMTLPKTAGEVSVEVVTGDACKWSALPGPSWTTITSNASGSGPGRLTFRVTANNAPTAREGVLIIADKSLKIVQ